MINPQDSSSKNPAVSEDDCRSLFDNMPQGVFYQAADGRILQGNNSCLELLGLTRDEFLERTSLDSRWQVFLPGGSVLAGDEHPSAVALRTGKPVEDVLLGIFNPRRQGIVWMTVNAVPEFQEGESHPYRVFVTMNDVTERKAAQDALVDSQFILDNASVEVFRFDEDGTILYANRLAGANLGYLEGELNGRYLWDIDPSVRPEIWPELRDAVSDRGGDERNSFHRRRDGSDYHVRVNTFVTDRDGRRLFTSIVQDVSQIKNADAVLDHQKTIHLLNDRIDNVFLSSFGTSSYHQVIDFLPGYFESPYGSLCYIGIGGHLICCTRGPTLITGASENLIDLPPEEWDGLWGRSISESVSIIIDTSLHLPGENRSSQNGICVPLIQPDGVIGLVIVSGKPEGYQQEDLEVLESVARQISWILNTRLEEDALRRQQEYLEARHLQRQELEMVGRLAGGVAHELNNLLTPVQGFSEILLEELEQQEHRDHAVQINDASKKAKELIRQLQAFGQKQDMEAVSLDINGLLISLQTILKKSLRGDVTLVMNLQDDLPSVVGDSTQLQHVMMNLILNARDALEDEGTITVETSLELLDAAYASTHEAFTEGLYVMIVVQDDGIGMEADILNNIFEPFFSNKDIDPGNGLGLAAVYGTVKQHKGNIWAYSEPGHGSVFRIYLPVEETPETPELIPPHNQTHSVNGSETILVVEDNEQVLKLVRTTLDSFGYRVLEASDGKQALELFEHDQDSISLLLTDVMMPVMNGQQLYLRITERRPDVKVLYMSGYTDQILGEDYIRNNEVNFIHKPFSINDLMDKVREVLDKKEESTHG
jgi:PAS domain S-box-containing protein